MWVDTWSTHIQVVDIHDTQVMNIILMTWELSWIYTLGRSCSQDCISQVGWVHLLWTSLDHDTLTGFRTINHGHMLVSSSLQEPHRNWPITDIYPQQALCQRSSLPMGIWHSSRVICQGYLFLTNPQCRTSSCASWLCLPIRHSPFSTLLPELETGNSGDRVQMCCFHWQAAE